MIDSIRDSVPQVPEAEQPDGAASMPPAPHESELPAPLSIDAKTAHWLPLALPLLAVTLLMTGLLVLSDI